MGDSAGAPALADRGEEPFLDAAWTEAIEATELLRTVLADLGLADGFPRLRGDVNVYGRPMVTVGRIEPAAARRLAAVLSLVADGTVRRGSSPSQDLPPPPVTPAPRTYNGGSTGLVDDIQTVALRLMRLAGGPAIPGPAADRDGDGEADTLICLSGPPSAARPVCEQHGLPFRADVAELDQVRSDPERLPA
jgi:hypothetical protein